MFISREKIDDFEWSNNPNVFYVFFKLLFKASYKDKKWEGIDIKRGQLVTGRVALSKELNVSEQVIRTCLDKLTKTGYINQQTTNRYTIITICNYDSWQVLPKTNNQQPTSEPTNNQPTDNHDINKYNKESKNIKEEKDSKESKKKKEELDFSIVAPEFIETVNLWIQYKKERKESYKPSGFVKMYAKLVKLSGNNPHKALKIIEQSMANNWSGFFQLKQDSLPLGFIQKDEGNEKYEKAETW